MTPSPASIKSELRQRFERYRRSLDEEAYEDVSRRVVKRLIALPEIRAARVVHVYWPIVASREIDTRPFIHWLKEQRKEIVLPVVVNFQPATDINQPPIGQRRRLDHVRYPGEEGLRLNRWGIAEPAEHRPVPVERLEAVVVPAFGAGRNGHRIGFGYGYYDEFLAGIVVPAIAVVYDNCLVDSVPAEDHDRAVDIVVTEREVVRPAR